MVSFALYISISMVSLADGCVNAMWTTESTHIVKLCDNLQSQASHDVETGYFLFA